MKRPDGRFGKALDPAALMFSSSLSVDGRLYREDIRGSLAHVAMLARQRIIPRRDAIRIRKALQVILGGIQKGTIDLARSGGDGRFMSEDVHMAIEARVRTIAGKVGGKLHTGRSRNDQVALDERLFLVGAGAVILASVRSLQRALVRQAKRTRDVIAPGYTHLQHAQPILLAHHLLAYVSMLDRDHGRFADALRRARVSPLGAGALAGSSLPLDRRFVARELRLDGIVGNSIDAVSDRDALIEFAAACSITMMHLSRFAEDLVLWSSQEWGFVTIGDGFTTGSSLMPQKRNPDMAELVRGKSGRVYGDLIALLTIMKGLPLAYNRDLQEDKEPLFDAVDTTVASLDIMTRMLGSVRFRRDRWEGMMGDAMVSTDLADYLVRKGIPFRDAHSAVGTLVGVSERSGVPLARLSLGEFRRCHRAFAGDVYLLFDPRTSVEMKQTEGSTSPSEVAKTIRRWERRLGPRRRVTK
jgi:argininosuccinate lyase